MIVCILCRKVFKQREAFERMINESEDRTTKVREDNIYQRLIITG